MKSNVEVIRQLQAVIAQVIEPLVPIGQKIALLDFPDYSNVGDSAIWMGELAYLRLIHNATPSYTSTIYNWNDAELRQAAPNGPILLSGGGNFGDIWPEHQDFRHKIVSHYRDRPIIQMPQSLHFSSEEALKQSASIINEHPAFTLLVRDLPSYEMAQTAFTCPIALCPDMAFFLGSQERYCVADQPLLMLLRTDKEASQIDIPRDLPDGTVIADWIDELPDTRTRASLKKLILLPSIGIRAFNRAARREHYYRLLAGIRTDRGLMQLSRARAIISDRLHVHILATLLNIPHMTLDNKYGKIARFREAWTSELGIASNVSSVTDGLQLLSKNTCLPS
jgi:exopolysaccharide biosynthesis predicted pyruvyltransferase EpsI